jgi:hypothetical protein
VTEKTEVQQAAEDTTNAAQPCAKGHTIDAHTVAERTRGEFNRYLYENLIGNVECQIECWNRKAVREPNPEAAHTLWRKAEGLGYALRLLYAFEPEFRELVDCASLSTTHS